MCVSKMSIIRVFDEIESLEIPVLCKEGRKRLISISQNRREMWERLRAYLRNPLLNEYYLKEDIGENSQDVSCRKWDILFILMIIR